MKLVVGLCNPEEKYIGTRHNSGKMIVDSFLRKLKLDAPSEPINKYLGSFWGPCLLEGEEVAFLEPHTGMNSSGDSVVRVSEHYSLAPQDILVISDDIDLPLGRIRIKATGSSGRHKGLDSILTTLGTTDIPRLRIGIGPKIGSLTLFDFVLGKFTAEELAVWPKIEEAAWDVLRIWLMEGINAAMTETNSKKG